MASPSFILTQQYPAVKNHDLDESGDSLPSEMVPMWPALIPDQSKDNEWEIVSPTGLGVVTTPVVTFDVEVMSQSQQKARNPKILKHSQSSPDLRTWNNINEESDHDEESSSAVLVEDEFSMESSGMDLVSEPPSVWSVGSNKLSFKDAILRQPAKTPSHSSTASKQRQAKKAVKTTFVVVKPVSQRVSTGMRRNSKSMGNLRALDHIQEDHDVLGDTDAGDFYSRKEKGAIARQNGQKQRPDEAKRLQITMAKKSMQKQRQRG